MERYIEAYYFDGDLYGLPTYRDLASQAGFMCRADILEELGYKAEDIKNFDDIEEVLKNARKYIGTLSDDSVGSEQWMF